MAVKPSIDQSERAGERRAEYQILGFDAKSKVISAKFPETWSGLLVVFRAEIPVARSTLTSQPTNRLFVPRIVHPVLRAATILLLPTFVINNETFCICNGCRYRTLSDLDIRHALCCLFHFVSVCFDLHLLHALPSPTSRH